MIIVLFIVTNAIAIVLFEALDGELQRYTIFLSPPNTIIGLGIGLFDNTQEGSEWADVANFPAWAYVAWTLGVTAVATAVMYLRYRPNE